jgi:HPt (histidine-containing phosphotransfer) domain-containing protein
MKEFSDYLRVNYNLLNELKGQRSDSHINRFNEVAEVFLKRAPQLLGELKEAVRSEVHEDIDRIARTLSTKLDSVGLSIVAEECRLLSEAAKRKLHINYEIKADLLEALVEEGLELIGSHLF